MGWLSDKWGDVSGAAQDIKQNVGGKYDKSMQDTVGGVDDYLENSIGGFEDIAENIIGGVEDIVGNVSGGLEDLMGGGAGEGSSISGILEESAAAGIAAQEEQRARIKELYAPYYEDAVSGGLPQVQAMAEGGEVDYTPSRLYEYSKKRGERNIKRTQAAKGQLGSSATAERLSDFRLGLAQEETDRLYAGQLSRLQLGAGAGDAVTAASNTLSGNVGALYSNLGSGLNAAQQGAGQARQSAYEGLAGALSGLSRYMEAA